MVDLSMIGGGQRPGRTQGNRKTNIPKFIQNLNPLVQDKTPNINLDIRGANPGIGEALEGVAGELMSFAEKDKIERRLLANAALKIADKQDTNTVNRMVGEYNSSVESSWGIASDTTDFGQKKSSKKYLDDAKAQYETALAHEDGSDLSDLHKLTYSDRLLDIFQKHKDKVAATSLAAINKTEEDRIDFESSKIGDEGNVDRYMSQQQPGGLDAIDYYINSYAQVYANSSSNVGFEKGESYERAALENARDTLADYHIRQGQPEKAEEVMEDHRFDRVDGTKANDTMRERIRTVQNEAPQVYWDIEQKKNVLKPPFEVNRNPERYGPKRNMDKIHNLNAFSAEMVRQAGLPEKHPEKRKEEELRQQYGLTIEQDEVSKKLAEIEEALKLVSDPKEKEALKKAMHANLLKTYAPQTKAEEAEEEALAEVLKTTTKVLAAQKVIKVNKDNAELIAEIKEEFFAKPGEGIKDSYSNAVRRAIGLILTGKASKPGETPKLDKIQSAKSLKLGAFAEKYKEKHPGAGAWTALAAAGEHFKKDDPGFLSEDVYIRIANQIFDRREGKKGQAAEAPLSESVSGDTPDKVNEHLQKLLSERKPINIEKTSGIVSGFTAFLTNLPGQFLSVADDQEYIRARTALLRVSREILTLTMKNDRFAIAEQKILENLLSGPELLTSAASVKTKLLRFQQELKIEIARSRRNINLGVNSAEELDNLIDYDRIDTMIDQFNLTPPIETISPKDIRESTTDGLDNFQQSVTDQQLLDNPEKLDAGLDRQEQEMEKLGLKEKKEPDVAPKETQGQRTGRGEEIPPELLLAFQAQDRGALEDQAIELANRIMAGFEDPNMAHAADILLNDIRNYLDAPQQ